MTVRFQQRDKQNSQNLNKDTFCRLPGASAQCFVERQKHPDAGILVNYDDDEFSQGYGQIKEAFRALTKDDILQTYISYDKFRSSNVRADDVGDNLFAFDMRHQQIFTASQPIEVEFSFDGFVPNDINGYALVLTNKIMSISSDRQRMFDLI